MIKYGTQKSNLQQPDKSWNKNRIYLPCAVSCFISSKDKQEMGSVAEWAPVSVHYDPFNSTLSSFVLRSWPHSPSGCFAWGCKFLLEMAKPKVSSTEAIKRITNNLLQCLFISGSCSWRWPLVPSIVRHFYLCFSRGQIELLFHWPGRGLKYKAMPIELSKS